ncbi:hypothetical protein [Cyclobacterium sp. SYSU L10401]|uniref:hypothetical protein n=1 Tax=Cyclobacterium sp. SYSU L10401 TaxID=2678657 RepID=UPI0013D83241|nr:hypothetical protein [Cyclobacterium sp. SYSU L10401]
MRHELNFKASREWTMNVGVHYLLLLLNHSNSIEPRLSASYAMDDKQRLSLGFGLHSQVQPLGTYFEPMEGALETAYQFPLIPLISYRIEF